MAQIGEKVSMKLEGTKRQKVAYDKSKFGGDRRKVMALQNILFNGNKYQGTGVNKGGKTDDRLDGKWGSRSLAQFDNMGLVLSADENTVRNTKTGDIYTYDPRTGRFELQELEVTAKAPTLNRPALINRGNPVTALGNDIVGVGRAAWDGVKSAGRSALNWLNSSGSYVPHVAGTNRFQQGGTMTNDLQQMIRAFAQWGANKYGKGQMTPEQFLQQVLQMDPKQQEQLLMEFQQDMQGGARKARLGAKLSYLKKLKGECSSDEEVKYFKRGGLVCKECVKKNLDGGKPVSDPIVDFKKARMEKCGGKAKKKC